MVSANLKFRSILKNNSVIYIYVYHKSLNISLPSGVGKNKFADEVALVETICSPNFGRFGAKQIRWCFLMISYCKWRIAAQKQLKKEKLAPYASLGAEQRLRRRMSQKYCRRIWLIPFCVWILTSCISLPRRVRQNLIWVLDVSSKSRNQFFGSG